MSTFGPQMANRIRKNDDSPCHIPIDLPLFGQVLSPHYAGVIVVYENIFSKTRKTLILIAWGANSRDSFMEGCVSFSIGGMAFLFISLILAFNGSYEYRVKAPSQLSLIVVRAMVFYGISISSRITSAGLFLFTKAWN